MRKPCILVAEDDPNIRMGLVDTLESDNFDVVEAADGGMAIDLFENRPIDLVLLDIMMPEKNGYDVCRQIRSTDPDVPIIMLTAKGEEIDKVIGLELGADDYITKPFGVHELLARIHAVLRRSARHAKPEASVLCSPSFSFGSGRVDPGTYKLIRAEDEIDLSEREIKLLGLFHAHTGQVLSRDQILNAVWGIAYLGTTRTLDQHIANLRKKVEPDPSKPIYITTVHGVGYRYDTPGTKN